MTTTHFLDGVGLPDGDLGSLISIVRAMLDVQGHRYQQLDADSLTLTIRRKDSSYTVKFAANDDTSLVRLSSNYGFRTPESRRIAVAEALSRTNTRLTLGNFELDFNDGELRFRVGADVENGFLSVKMVENMLTRASQTMERFQRALMSVAFGEVSPAIAIAEVA